MKYILKNSILGTLITTIAITAYPIDVDAAATNGNTKKEQYVVTLDDNTDYIRICNEYADNMSPQNTERSILGNENITVLTLDDNTVEELAMQDGVISIEKDIVFNGLSNTANNTNTSDLLLNEEESKKIDLEQWYLNAIAMPNNELNTSKEEVKIEILDSGISYTEDINVAQRVNLILGDEEVSILYDDGNGHGTGIAGIIGALDNEEGITGINPNAQIYSVKALDSANTATLSRIINGIYWGIEHGMNIINMSFGTSINSAALHEAIKAAYDADILLVAAAGNEKEKMVQYPAAYKEVMAVGATGIDGKQISAFTSGNEIEILAPGDKIVTTGLFDGIITAAGTSLSSAEITAAASILWSIDISKPSDFIRKLLKVTGKQVENTTDCHANLIDLSKALENYNQFALEYSRNSDGNIENVVNNQRPENFEELNIVNGLWGKTDHANIVKNYLYSETNIGENAYNKLNDNRVSIMATMVQLADSKYGTQLKGASCLHGTGIYGRGLKYLLNCAQYIRIGKSISDASKMAYEDIENVKMPEIQNLKKITEEMLNENLADISADESNPTVRYFKVLGFALHCIQDVFAHRAIILQSDFTASNFPLADFEAGQREALKKLVDKKEAEYRDIKKYVKGGSNKNSKYEDNPNLAPSRFKDAKKQSAYMLQASLNNKGYNEKWFTEPAFNTKLMFEEVGTPWQ